MRPQDPSTNDAPSRDLAVPARDAAADVVRGQISALYDDSRGSTSETPSPQAASAQQTASREATDAQSDHWKQYHSAWQQYYQKYYEQYYTGHMHRILTEQRQQSSSTTTPTPAQAAPQPTRPVAASSSAKAPEDTTKTASRQEALDQLRQKLKSNVKTSAKKVRKSRHFIPVMAAVCVVMVVAFLQYNSVLMATVQAYVSPGAIDPQNIVVDPTGDTKVGPEPKLIIPKINVDVPVVYGIPYTGNSATDNAAQMRGMEQGVIHFAMPGANSVPGQIGNTAISGHSSNDLFEAGDYKFVFAQLEKLEQGDTIYMNYEGTRYTYTVTRKEVVGPKDGNKLAYATDKPMLTLITCTPLGTSTNRLLVTAEQVSPDPAKAAPAPDSAASSVDAMPGNSPTALQKLFGAR